MKIKLLKIQRPVKYIGLGIIFQFLFSGIMYATPLVSAEVTVSEKKEVSAQSIVVKGTVISEEDNIPIPGVNIMVKGTNIGAVTDFDGEFVLKISNPSATLIFSYMGYKTIERKVTGSTTIQVTMAVDNTSLDEVIVVGYGKQKKASVVAAVTQVKGETLEQAGGVSSIGAALTGNAPGVITTASTGMPGDEDPQISIRGQSTWNGSSPLILVDGVERSMNSVAISEVESLTVLKDASATAVYGVRGANGVILITTKRGEIGKTQIRARVNTTMKVPSKLPGKYDAFDALMVRNDAIENELSLSPESWNDYLPFDIINKYRNPSNLEEAERYPNVDWADILFKDYTMSYNASVNVNGGTNFVKYFAGVDFLSEGDLFKDYDNGRGYDPGYGFNRLNVRSNLDFEITPTTKLRVNLSGSHGVRKNPWGADGSEYTMWDAAYSTAPDVFLPRYSDGSWGYYAPNEGKASNSVRNLAISGIQYRTQTKLTTDFTLDQSLDMLVDGLSFKGVLALDNTFSEGDRGVNDLFNNVQEKWIDPVTGLPTYKQAFDSNNRFDFQEGVKWSTTGGSVQDWASYRRLYYQLQLDYNVKLDKHNITAMGLMNRNEFATGSQIPNYREDWVFRTTYGYADKYLFEYNGAYNGSEKFSEENRFAFFSSGGIGWVLSKEKFMESLTFIDFLKLRASYGEIGDDNINGRFLYLTQWGYGGNSTLGTTGETAESSPYTWYNETAVGNPDVHWEKVKKTNFGLDYEFLDGFVTGSFDYFIDDRSDILISGDRRAIPSYYGTQAPVANLGRVRNKGFEFEVKLNHTFANGLNLWSEFNVTHVKDEILNADDPGLLPDYQKQKGKQIGQAYSYVSNGYYNNWDELYATTMHNTNDNQKLPGNYAVLDFNADGILDTYDNIPYGFAGRPQNTFNTTVGFNWKGLSGYVQFYGVNNVSRQVVLNSLSSQNHVVYEVDSYWSKDNVNGAVPVPTWLSTPNGAYTSADRFFYDGSYLRLKNAEIAYTFFSNSSSWVKSLGVNDLKLYLNGNNLFLWTDMPDDREANFAGTGWASQGAYPSARRFNLGLNVTF